MPLARLTLLDNSMGKHIVPIAGCLANMADGEKRYQDDISNGIVFLPSSISKCAVFDPISVGTSNTAC